MGMSGETSGDEALPRTLGSGSLAAVFREHPERRYVMFGGKGGLGKTTFSAATAFWLAQRGHKVMVFSVDPQASLSDIFQRDIFGQGPVKIMDNLWAQEIEDYIQAASAEPAMEESAIFDAVVDIVVGGEYDYYIYDLVPLGHALYYLSMAKVYDEWITKITHLREEMRDYEEIVAKIRREGEVDEDKILSELQYIRGRINAASRILVDREKTAFFFVVIPEEMVLADTRQAAEMFAHFDVPIAGYVVNRVLPEELLTEGAPTFLSNRIRMQRRYLDQIDSTLGEQILARIPELERDVTGLDVIERTAKMLFRE